MAIFIVLANHAGTSQNPSDLFLTREA